MIVADTNLIAYIVIPGPLSSFATEVLQKDREWVAPALWRSEMRNLLLGYVRRGEMSVDEAAHRFREASTLLAKLDIALESGEVLEAAVTFHLSAYDAEFVALARYLKVPLVTSDKDILRNAAQIAISMEHFATIR